MSKKATKGKKQKAKKQIPLAAVLAIVVVIVAAVGYMALIRPKQAEASKLDTDIQTLESKLSILTREQPQLPEEEAEVVETQRIKVADLVKLAKAMPEDDDMAGVLLELDAVSSAAGVKFVSIQPQAPVDEGFGYRRMAIQVVFDGNYYDLAEVLYDLRSQVRVRDGRLDADGRLFSLDQLDLHESQTGFPKVEAVMTISAYLYGAGEGSAAVVGVPTAPAATPIAAPQPAPAGPGATDQPGSSPTGSTPTETAATETINRDPENPSAAPAAGDQTAPAGGS